MEAPGDGLLTQLKQFKYINLVPRTFTLTWGWGPSQGKGPGNEVANI